MTTLEYAKEIGITNTKLKYWIQKSENKETEKTQVLIFLILVGLIKNLTFLQTGKIQNLDAIHKSL
jgi:hypothetical protein